MQEPSTLSCCPIRPHGLSTVFTFLVGLLVGYKLNNASQDPQDLVWNSELAAFESKWIKFNGSFETQSPYRGYPNGSIDRE